MSDDRIQQLESIGFQWSQRCGKLKNGEAAQWDAQFQDLKKYKEKHGGCNVPTGHGRLGIWVKNQRTSYQSLKNGKYSPMFNDHIQKLQSICFQWSIKNREVHQLWDAQFQELKRYKEKHGDCNVP